MAAGFLEVKRQLPVLGIGLGLRDELADDTFNNPDCIDWLEFVPENFMGLGGSAQELIEKFALRFPLVSHGVNLSIGSTDELNQDYLTAIKQLLDKVNCPWWSDHLCFSSVDGVYMHDLLPLPFSAEAVRHIAGRIKKVQDFVERPFLIENISFYMHLPGCELNEAQFLSEVVEQADCGLLLDVNNIYVNSLNHGFDPYEFLNSIPLHRTVQVHVAGHERIKNVILDTHGEAVIQPVYDLLKFVLQRVPVNAVMLERDQNFPDFAEITRELKELRLIASQTQPALLGNTAQQIPLNYEESGYARALSA